MKKKSPTCDAQSVVVSQNFCSGNFSKKVNSFRKKETFQYDVTTK